MMRGFFLKSRLAVNGIQYAFSAAGETVMDKSSITNGWWDHSRLLY
jgi:hypothetical protein